MNLSSPFVLLAILLAGPVFSQTDSFFLHSALQERMATTAGDPVYIGRQHVPYNTSIVGMPYFNNADWQKGTLLYQDVLYRYVLLKYDLVANELVIRHPNGATAVVLFTPRIGAFTLGEKKFVGLQGDGTNKKAGIYEELATGKLSLYEKHSKLYEENLVGMTLEQRFTDQNRYYVLKDGQWFSIKSEKDVLNLTGDKKAETKAWFKTTKIKFKKEPETALVSIVAHYNQSIR